MTGTFEVRREVKTLSDGSLELTMSPIPAQGPAVEVVSKTNCPVLSQTTTMPFPVWGFSGPYKLVNGIYRNATEGALPPGATGRIWSEVTLEQKSMRRRQAGSGS